MRNNIYRFKEAKLGTDFCSEKIAEIRSLIESNTSFTLAGMPAVGLSTFLKYLVSQNFANFIHIDLYALTQVSKLDFFRLILKELGSKENFDNEQEALIACQTRLLRIAQSSELKTVLVFNRFDTLEQLFDSSFFNNLRALKQIDLEKIVMVFGARNSLVDLFPESIVDSSLYTFSNTVYLKPYTTSELTKIIKLYGANIQLNKKDLQKAMSLSGGHHQLLQLLLSSGRLDNPLMDRFVNLRLRELFTYLTFHQKKLLEKIASGKKVDHIDEYLLNIGLVVLDGDNSYKLFTPLLAEYINSNAKLKLPQKENTLFKLLKQNIGQVITKDQIYDAIWANDPENASEWALNALIYRLRKNSVFSQNGYIIENHKKIGYILYQD